MVRAGMGVGGEGDSNTSTIVANGPQARGEAGSWGEAEELQAACLPSGTSVLPLGPP